MCRAGRARGFRVYSSPSRLMARSASEISPLYSYIVPDRGDGRFKKRVFSPRRFSFSLLPARNWCKSRMHAGLPGRAGSGRPGLLYKFGSFTITGRLSRIDGEDRSMARRRTPQYKNILLCFAPARPVAPSPTNTNIHVRQKAAEARDSWQHMQKEVAGRNERFRHRGV